MQKNSSKATPEMQFWSCLKNCDVDGLEKILLRRVVDPETAAVKLEIDRQTAHRLVNAPNAKKKLPLSYAVSRGMDEQGLHLLLRAGSDVNAADGASERSTALHAACWGEDDVAVALFLRCGANPLVTDSECRTPLHVLASLNAAELFSYFLETTTNRTSRGDGVERRDGLLYLDGHPSVVVSPVDLLGKGDIRKYTVLHTALSDVSSSGDGVVADLLDYLETIASTDPATVTRLVNMTTESGGNPLHLLLSGSNCSAGAMIRIVGRLLQLGANPGASDNLDHTPLSLAVRTHLGAVIANVLQLLLQAVQRENDWDKLERVFVQYDLEDGYTLINHAISVQNTEAVKTMVAFLKSLDEANGSNYVRQWLGEVLTANNKSVVQMLADVACDEIAHVLINNNAIVREEYELCRSEADKRKREEKESEERRKKYEREEYVEEDSENIYDGSSVSKGYSGGKKKVGDFSGFGSSSATTAATVGGGGGSRVQQARKARAQAVAQRKKQVHHDSDNSNGKIRTFYKGVIPLWLKVAVVCILLSVMYRVYTLLQRQF